MNLWVDDQGDPSWIRAAPWVVATTTAAAITLLRAENASVLSIAFAPFGHRLPCACCDGGLPCPDHAHGHGLIEWLARNPDRMPKVVEDHGKSGLGTLYLMHRLAQTGWQ